AEAPQDCKPPKSFTVRSVELRPTEPIGTISPGPGISVTLHDPGVTVVGDGTPQPLAPDGSYSNEVTFGGLGTMEYDVMGVKGVADVATAGTTKFAITGKVGEEDGVLRIDSVLPEMTGTLKVGAGLPEPTYKMHATFAAKKAPRRYVPPTPSVAKAATLVLDFVKSPRDSATFSGTFDRLRPPNLVGGKTAVLRVGAHRLDVTLSKKGATGRGSPAVVVLRTNKKTGTFKIVVRKSDLRAELAALPAADHLPRGVAWSLVL